MNQKLSLPGGCIAMSSRTCDLLLANASGDAALLFLHLLRTGGLYDPENAAKVLRFEPRRVEAAFRELERLELVTGTEVDAPPVPDRKEAPEYTAEMVSEEMERSAAFPSLVREVEQLLGNQLSFQNLQQLMELYDYLHMPAEVLFLLTRYMVEETEWRRGPGVRPRMWEIKREGYRWASRGLDSLEAATAFAEKMSYFRTVEGGLLAAVGITGRTATNQEKTYLSSWLEMGFGEAAVQLAAEKTLTNTGKWNWSYCNGILKSWHKKNLHTVDEIATEEAPARPEPSRPQKGVTPAAGAELQQLQQSQEDDFYRMQKLFQDS